MGLWVKKDKVCATCMYWRGERNLDFMFIEAKRHEDKCLCEYGFLNLKTIEGASCSNWKGYGKE